MIKLPRLAVFLCISGLASCTINDEPMSTHYTQSYPAYTYGEAQYFAEGSNGAYDYRDNADLHQVKVPESYHVGAYHSPTSFKDRDRDWVSTQNPQGYTIELANGDKASSVANRLFQAPKTNRTAEIKYYQNGKPYYRGVYGSYNTQEEAQKALEQLPADLKQGAGVKNWGAMQR